MKYIKEFEDMIQTSQLSIGQKVNLFCRGSWFWIDKLTGEDEVYNISKRDLFLAVKQDELMKGEVNLDFELPAWGFERNLTAWLIDYGYPTDNIYNLPDASLAVDKVTYYKNLQAANSKFLSRTVYSFEDAQDPSQITFPIIAKVEGTWQSKGVEKFDTLDDLSKSKVPFNVFQEAIKIDKEYRAIVFRGIKDKKVKVLSLSLREPCNDKAQDLRVNESQSYESLKDNESAHFKWTSFHPKDHFTQEQILALEELINEATTVVPDMNVLSVDFAFDKAGKIWHLEANKTPGVNGIIAALVYLNIFKDWYGLALSGNDVKEMKNIMYKLVEKTKPSLPFDIDESLIYNNKNWYGLL